MAMDRVAFVPWNEAQAGNFKKEYEINERERGSSHNKRKWTIVYLDTPGKPLADMGFGLGARLHIGGHGAIGDANLYADHGTGGQTRTIPEIVDALFEKGLKKHYLGTVACDVCYSALGTPSFAKTLARELWARGVKASCVLGYKGSLYAQYYGWNKGSEKYTHRRVELDDGTKVKSNEAQERFYGWT